MITQTSSISYSLNLASILLGIAAIVFAIHSVQVKGCLICCIASLSLCCISILCQLFQLKRLAAIGDWAAIEDTIGARCFAAVVLLSMVMILNIAALLRGRKKTCSNC